MFPFVSVPQKPESLRCIWIAADDTQGGLVCAWVAERQESSVNEEPSAAEQAGELRRCA